MKYSIKKYIQSYKSTTMLYKFEMIFFYSPVWCVLHSKIFLSGATPYDQIDEIENLIRTFFFFVFRHRNNLFFRRDENQIHEN